MQTPQWVKISKAFFIATLILAGPFHMGGCLMIMGEPDERATPAKRQRRETFEKVIPVACVISWPCILATGIWHERLRSKWTRASSGDLA